MAKFEKFEDILAWQKSRSLINSIYLELKDCKDYPFCNQIQRAAVSIMNNISEGYERKGNKEFIKFLYIAKGSCAEVRSMLYLAIDLNYIDEIKSTDLNNKALEISKMLSGLIKSLS